MIREKELTVSLLVGRYIRAKLPPTRCAVRKARTQEQVRYALKRVASFPEWPLVRQLNMPAVKAYADWRRNNAKLKNGAVIRIELRCLREALRWAELVGDISQNPLANSEFPNFSFGKTVHCRDSRVKDANELHRFARIFFAGYGNWPVLGWQMLLEAFTGLRTSEALALRQDALIPETPGFEADGVLYVKRCKGGTNPYVIIHPALRTLLDELRAWHKTQPTSIWFFPRHNDPMRPVRRDYLSRELNLMSRYHGDGTRRVSHGLRAYYATARRSEGVDDRIVAHEMGDRTGEAIIVSTYGSVPPNWKSTSAGKIGWLPADGPPAWEFFRKREYIPDHCI